MTKADEDRRRKRLRIEYLRLALACYEIGYKPKFRSSNLLKVQESDLQAEVDRLKAFIGKTLEGNSVL